MNDGTMIAQEVAASDQRDAQLRLMAWREAASWLDYAAEEWVADVATRDYLEHVAQCQRDEAERRYASRAGFEPVAA